MTMPVLIQMQALFLMNFCFLKMKKPRPHFRMSMALSLKLSRITLRNIIIYAVCCTSREWLVKIAIEAQNITKLRRMTFTLIKVDTSTTIFAILTMQ
jgi:hypothetical protein